MNIRDYLKNHILVTDGAMGTYYSEMYQRETRLVEQAVLNHPGRIQKIHEQYLLAGARLLRTDSFAVNASFFPEEEKRLEIVRKSYQIAQKALQNFKSKNPDEEVFIAADIGTVFDIRLQDEEISIRQYQKILDAFIEEGATVFLFETQLEIGFLPQLFSYIKAQVKDAFIMVSFSFDKDGYTRAGLKIERMMYEIGENPMVDAYGLNCGMDPTHMYNLIQSLSFLSSKYFMALPNAGYPAVLRGRPVYSKNNTYFARTEREMPSFGVDIIGGCCGTNPQVISLLTENQNKILRGEKKIFPKAKESAARTESAFWKKLNAGVKTFVVELDPPVDMQTKKVEDGAKLLSKHGVDLLTLSDSPMGRTRMDASLLGSVLQRTCHISVMPHVSCRDRNLIGLRAMMLGSYFNDIRHYLLITGDPVPQADRSSVTQVFDYNSIRFMSLVHEMNEDVFAKDRVVYGGALNYAGANPDAIASRMRQKMEQGCSYFLTQPVYSQEDIERLAYLKRETGAKIIGGIMPLVSYRNAMFLSSEMPGIHIPQEIVEQYTSDMTRETAEETAVHICVSIAKEMAEVVDGYYLMTPFNRVELICRIIEAIRKTDV